MAFNINAQVILSGPKNLGKISKQIQRGLGKSGSIKVAIDPSSLRNIKILNSTVSNLNGNIANLNQSATKLQSTLTGVNSGLSKANTATSNFSKNQNNTASSIKNVNNALQQQNQQLGNLGKRFLSTAKTAIAFGLISRPIYDLQRAFIGATKDAVAFEREIVKISQVTGQTVKQLGNLRNDINRLATSLGVSANELAETARIIAQTGQTAENTRVILEALSRSTLAPTFGSITDTTEGLVAALGQFNLEAKDSEAILGALNRVSKNFAVEAEDLISVIRRTGGVFAQAAGDSRGTIQALEELIAVFTAVRSTTRESADTIAAGLRTIFSRIQRRGTIEFLEQFNIQLTNAKGQFIGVFPAFDELSRKLDTLIRQGDALTLSAIAEELGGIRQIGKLLPAIAQFDKARAALEEAQKGATEGLSGDVSKALDTIDNRLKRVRESFNELIRTVFESPAFQAFAKTILTVSEQLLKLSTGIVKFIEPLLPVLAALGAAKLGQVVGGAIGGGGLASAASTVSGQATATNTAQVAAAAQQSVSIEQQMLSVLNQMSTQLSNIFSLQSADNKLRNGQLSNLIQINQSGFNQVATAQRASGATPAFAGVRGPRRRASGGQIYGFNRGGMVPGTGNRDTVPAMLTPGEFVIKKSSVESIGAGNLAAMNFNNGGKARGGGKGRGNRAYVFDFDDTLGVSGSSGKELFSSDPELAAARQDKLRNAKATSLANSARKRSQQGYDVHVLTARFGSPQDEAALKDFLTTAGIKPGRTIFTGGLFKGEREPGKRPGTTRQLSTATKKARILEQLAAQYESILFLDDAIENVVKAQGVKGVTPIAVDKKTQGLRRKFAKGGLAVDFKGSRFGGIGFTGTTQDNQFATITKSDNVNKIKEAIAGNPSLLPATGVKRGDVVKSEIGTDFDKKFNEAKTDDDTITFSTIIRDNIKKKLGLKANQGVKGFTTKSGKVTATKKTLKDLNKESEGKIFKTSPGQNKPIDLENINSIQLEGIVSTFITAEKARDAGLVKEVGEITKDAFAGLISSITKSKSFKVGVEGTELEPSDESLKSAVSQLINTDPKSARTTIEGYVLEGLVSAIGKIPLEGSDEAFDFLGIRSASVSEGIDDIFGGGAASNLSQLKAFDAKRTINAKSRRNIILKKIPTIFDSKDVANVRIIEKNKGGGISGQDTVPALLTPGEFVFNKKAASRIGYGNLNRMNKDGVQGFNKGGVVGFKNGGKATGGGSFDFGKLQEASGKAVQGFGNLTSTAFLLQGSLTSTSSLFEEGGLTFSNVIGSVTTSLLAFQSVLAAIQSLQLLGSFGGLSKAIKGVPGLLKGGLGGLNKKLGGLGKRLQAGFGDSAALTGKIGKAQEKLGRSRASRKQFLGDAFDPNTQRFRNRSKAGKEVGKGTFSSLKDVKTGKSQFGRELAGRNRSIRTQAGNLRGLQNKIKIPGLDKFSKLLGRIPGGGAAGRLAGQIGSKGAAQIGKVLAAGISGPVAAALGTALVAIPLGSFVGKALGEGFDKLAFGEREEVAGFKGREGQGAGGAAASGAVREGLGTAGLGAGIGAAIGTAVAGPVGTAIGAAIGAGAGLIIGTITGAINGPLEQASFEAAKKLQKDTEQVGKSLEQFAKSGSIADFDTFLDDFLAQGDATNTAFETFTNQFDNQVGLLDFTPIGSFTKGLDAAGKAMSGDFVGAANSAVKGLAGSTIAGAVGSGAARAGAGVLSEGVDLSNLGKSLDDAFKRANPFAGTRLAQIVNTQFGGAIAGLNFERIGKVLGKGAENIRANIKKFGEGVAKGADEAFKSLTGVSFGEAKKNIEDGLKNASDAFNQAATAAFRATPIGLVSYLLGPAETAADSAEGQAKAVEEQAKIEAQARGKAAKVTQNQLKAVERIQTLIDPKQVEEARKALSQGLQKLVETGELGVDFEGLDVSTEEGAQEARSRIRAKAEEQSPEGERARKLLAAESQQITNELAVVSKKFKEGGDKAGKKTGKALDSLQAAIQSGQIDPSNQEEVNAFLGRFGAAGKQAAVEFEKISASSDGALGAAINAGLLAKALKEAEKALNTFNAELKTIQDDLAFATESSAVALSNLKDTTDALSNGQILFTQKLDGFDFGKAGAGARQDRIAAIGATTGVNVEGIQKFDTVISNADEIGKDAFEELSSRAEDGKASLQDVTSALEKGIEKELGFELPEGPLKEGLKKSLEGFGRQLGDGSDIPLDKLKEAIEDGKVGELLGPAFEEVQKTTKQLSETFNQLNNIAAEEANLRLQIAQQQLEAQKEVRKRTRAIEDTAIDPEKAFKGDPLALAQKRLDEDIADLGFAGKSAVEIAEAQRQARDEQIKLNEQLQAGTISQEEFAKKSADAANANANASAALNQLANDTTRLSAIQQKAAKLIEARDASRQQVTDEIVARETGDVAGIARRREQSRVVQAGIQEGASQGDRRRLLVAAAQDPSLQREIALQQRAQARERGDTSLEGLTTQEIFDKTLIEDLESRLATESDPLERARIEQQIEDIKAPGLEDLQKQAVEIQQNQLAVQQLIAANQQLLLQAQLASTEKQREELKAELAKNTEKLNGLLQQQGQQAATQQEQAQTQQQQLQAQQEQTQQQAAGATQELGATLAGATGATIPPEISALVQDINEQFQAGTISQEEFANAAGAVGAGTGGIAATTPALEKLNKALEDNQKSVESGGYGFSEAAKQSLEQAQKYRQLEAESIAAGNTDLARQQGGIAEQFETSANVRGFGTELSPVLNTGAAQRSIGEGLRGRTVRQDMKLSKSDQRFLEKGQFADRENARKKASEDRIAKRNRIDQELKRREDEARKLSSGRAIPGPNLVDALRGKPQGTTQAESLQDSLKQFQSLFGEFGAKIQENAQVMLDAADIQNAAGEKQIQAADTMPTNISHNMNTIEVNGLGNLANGIAGFANDLGQITQNLIDSKNPYEGAPEQGDGVSPRNLG